MSAKDSGTFQRHNKSRRSSLLIIENIENSCLLINRKQSEHCGDLGPWKEFTGSRIFVQAIKGQGLTSWFSADILDFSWFSAENLDFSWFSSKNVFQLIFSQCSRYQLFFSQYSKYQLIFSRYSRFQLIFIGKSRFQLIFNRKSRFQLIVSRWSSAELKLDPSSSADLQRTPGKPLTRQLPGKETFWNPLKVLGKMYLQGE